MKTFLIALLLLSGTYGIAIAQKGGDIQVTVNAIEAPGEGTLVFMLFISADGFPADPRKAQKIGRLTNYTNAGTYTFSDVAPGEYALAVFQDKNGNGRVDTNFIGLPKEPVGAYQHSSFGKPSFTKCSFTHETNTDRLQVQLLNQ